MVDIKKYYKHIIDKLNQYTIFSGTTAYIEPKVLDNFEFKNMEHIVPFDNHNMSLFSFTLKDTAPESVFEELLEIYARVLVGLSDVFLERDIAQADMSIELSAMIGELE